MHEHTRRLSKKIALDVVQIFYPLLQREEEIREAISETQKIVQKILENHRLPPPEYKPSEN